MFKAWLAHPLTKDRDIDDPNIANLRRHILQEKPFLRKIYREWYTAIETARKPMNFYRSLRIFP
jgi:hypothetical protein